MPANPKFLSSHQLLEREDILTIAHTLVDLGIDEIRLTGGEPTLRPRFPGHCSWPLPSQTEEIGPHQ